MLRIEPLILDHQSRLLYEHFVPAHHPLRQMDEALDFSFILDLLKDRYNLYIGCPAKHPELMWRLLFAQYYLNLSDEKICLAAHESLALRLFLRLGMDEAPPHPSTLQKFRWRRLKEQTYLDIHFALLQQSAQKGVLDYQERQIWDTTHVRSNTRVVSIPELLLQARRKVIKEVTAIDPAYGTELQQQTEVDRAAYRAERARRIKTGEPKPSKEEKINATIQVVTRTWMEVGKRISSGQLEATERLNVWLAVLEKVIHDRADGATERIVSVHDLEARKGKKTTVTWDGRKIAIDMQEDSRMIMVGNMVAGNVNDCQVVEALIEQQEEGLSVAPPELTGDKGADTGPVRDSLQKRGIQAHIPVVGPRNHQGAGLFTVDDFRYFPRLQILICPAGKTASSPKRQIAQWQDGYVFTFRRSWCQACELKQKCQRQESKKGGRTVYIGGYWSLTKAATAHEKTPAFQVAYGKRSRIEAKLAELVYHGGRRCRYRGDARSQVQLLLLIIAVNGKRLTKLLRRKAARDSGPGARSALRAA